MPPLARSPSRNQCAPILRFGNGIIVQFAVPVKRHATRPDSIPWIQFPLRGYQTSATFAET
jgi:hypothetical protein